MTKGLPLDELERQARSQRSLLQDRVVELRQTVKERLDWKRNIRDHLWVTTGALVLVGTALGYALTGVFTRK